MLKNTLAALKSEPDEKKKMNNDDNKKNEGKHVPIYIYIWGQAW